MWGMRLGGGVRTVADWNEARRTAKRTPALGRGTIEIEIEIVYNMYRMRRFFTKKPDASAAVSGPSQLRQTGNLQVRARP